jgi:hypothetical protein
MLTPVCGPRATLRANKSKIPKALETSSGESVSFASASFVERKTAIETGGAHEIEA